MRNDFLKSRNMRTTICNLVLVSKYENGHMKISISSRQVRARKIILNLNLNLEKLNLLSRMRVRLHLQQSYFEAPSVCFMKNLSKNKIYRARVQKLPSLNSTHYPKPTVSRVTDFQIGRSWWSARWTTTSRWAKMAEKMRRNLWDYQVEIAGL